MRLTEFEQLSIVKTFHEVFEKRDVYLFGSRIDNAQKKEGLKLNSEETFLYADVASRGQVGQSDYPWEKLDELENFEGLK